MRKLCLSFAIALAIFAASLPAPPVEAKSSASSNAQALERQRQEQERAREQARQERAREREQARLERERAREERKQAREHARQEREAQRQQKAAQQKAAKAVDDDDDDNRPTATAGITAARATAQETSTVPSKAQKPAAKKDDDDDDDPPTKGQSSSSTSKRDGNRTTRRDAAEASEPPATVAEWLKRLGYAPEASASTTVQPPASTSSSRAALAPASKGNGPAPEVTRVKASSGDQVDAKTSTDAKGQKDPKEPAAGTPLAKGATEKEKTAGKETTRRPPAPARDPLVMPKPGEARSNELLAVGMTPQAIEVAQKNGIVVTSTFSKPGAPPVTQLTLPKDMPPHVARDLLRGTLPPQAFALNHVYRHHYHHHLPPPHHPGFGAPMIPAPNATTAASGPVPAAPLAIPNVPTDAGTKGCTLARCFAPRLIGWQDTLAACTVGTRIGVIDTSVERRHPALADARIIERAFTPSGSQPSLDGHGTSVLALLAGNAKSGTPGLAPKAEYLVANVFGTDTNGKPVSDTFSLLKAIEWLHRNSVQVVNVSLAGPHDPLLQKAMADYSAKGMMFVAAAGNEGPGAAPSYPAAYPEVIAVTAVDKDLRSYRHANRGAYIDVAAPGVGVWTALPQAKAGPMSGTSFATPHVTAMVASVHAGATDRSKQGILSLFSTQDLGPAGPDPIYGRGLILAPSSCRPGGGSSIAATGGWGTTIVPAGLTRSR